MKSRGAFRWAENGWALLLLIALLGFAARIFRINAFDLNGDEWYSIVNAQTLGRSYYSFLYFPLLTLTLNLFHCSLESLRILSAFFGALTIPVVFAITDRIGGKRAALWAAFLFAFSAFNIAESQEMRMYSLFCFLSGVSIFVFLSGLEKKRHSLFFAWILITLLNLMVHFNAVFLFAGQVGALLWFFLVPKIKTRRQMIILTAILSLVFLGGVLFRETVFFSILRLAEPGAVLKSGIRGYSLGTLLKFPFTIYQFIFGPNTSPYEFWVIPMASLWLGTFAYGVWLNRKTNFLIHIIFLFIFPIFLLLYVAEPLSNPGFTLVMPKHAIFSFPVFIAPIALGVDGMMRKKGLRILIFSLLFICFGLNLFSYYYPAFSYYSGRSVRFHKMLPYFKQLSAPKTMCVVDGRSLNPFKHYLKNEITKCESILNPEEFVMKELGKADRLILAVSDWSAYHSSGTLNAKDRNATYLKMLGLINANYVLEDGFVDYPLFFYVFKKDEKAVRSKIVLPVDFYDFRYQDIRLPVKIEDNNLILNSFYLSSKNPDWTSDPVSFEKSAHLAIYLNLEKSDAYKDGTPMASLEISDVNGKSEKLNIVKGENVWDSMETPADKISKSSVGTTWIKYPLISSSIKYANAARQFRAGIFKIKIEPLALEYPIRVKVRYFKEAGALRLWGIFEDN